MFAFFERLLQPFPEEAPVRPPETFLGFCLHFLRPAAPWLAIVGVLSGLIGLFEVLLFSFIGYMVDLLASSDPATFFELHQRRFILMGLLVAVVFPLVISFHSLLVHQTLLGNMPMTFRWQAHRYVLGHSLSFFANEFAGRIGTKVMQTSLAVRDVAMKVVDILSYVAVYFLSIVLMVAFDSLWLMLPFIVWLAFYILILSWFIPRLRHISEKQADARSMMTGRVIDSYTNISTVKLFSHAGNEAGYAKRSMLGFLDTVYRQMRLSFKLEICVDISLILLLISVAWLGLGLWTKGLVSAGAVAVALSVIMRLWGLAHWIMWEMAALFENVGVVKDGMNTLSIPREVQDRDDAVELRPVTGHIKIENINFDYGRQTAVLESLNLEIQAGEKVGLVGRSGAGKTTLVNLLLRLYEADTGDIRIDGQSIGSVTQDSLRSQISVVTQDTSLLHRSIFENIAYGGSRATLEQVRDAAHRANALEFIEALRDSQGRTGFDAQVGERGVMLSGGQRQRIAIARVFLKDAPILVMDEATSALDSESEAAISDNLLALMENKTVIAIAHRLSTIAALDRLVVLDNGRIIEEGAHQALIDQRGVYASLWHRQSGGFLPER